LAILNKNN